LKNPIVDGWFADPESRVYDGKVYIYVTNSKPYEEQTNLSLVVSENLKDFKVYENILDMKTFHGANFAIWAPSVIEKNGKYYIIFAANDIHSEDEIGGLYLGVSDTPTGVFKNVFEDGRPFINEIYNNAQPIDAHFFEDNEKIYLYYGGWGHMMVGIMNEKMDGLEKMEEPCFENIVREITPESYVEAPYVMKIDSKYHLMYSSGNWTNESYCVKAALADNPYGEFKYYADILKASAIADGPGHNSAFMFEGEYYVAYHRRIVGDENPHHRILCIDKLSIKDGLLQEVICTGE
jgi:beta-xylosidase